MNIVICQRTTRPRNLREARVRQCSNCGCDVWWSLSSDSIHDGQPLCIECTPIEEITQIDLTPEQQEELAKWKAGLN